MLGAVRSRVVVAAVIVLVAAGVVAATLLLTGSDDGQTAYVGSSPPARVPLPEFTLPLSGGGSLSSADLEGKVVAVTFLDAQCEADCPIVASIIGDGLRELTPEERAQVAAVAVSVDPPEDTPDAVGAFLRNHQVEGLLSYLVAPVDQMRPVWEDFSVLSSFDTGEDDLHSVPVQIYDADGVWVATLNAGTDLTPENLAHDLRAALDES